MNEVFQFDPTTLSANNKPESVTTVAFAPCQLKGNALLALGLENGFIELWKVPIVEGSESALLPEFLHSLPPNQCHASTVKKIAWRPFRDDSSKGNLVFATCSSDNGCRIFEVSSSNNQ